MSTLYPADISSLVPKALRQSGYYYVVLFDKECRFLWTNSVFDRKYPAPRNKNWEGQSFAIFLHPDDVNRAWEAGDAVLKANDLLMELQVRQKAPRKSTYDYGRWELSSIELENGEKVLLGVGHDYTRAEKESHALSAFQQAFELVINQFPDGLYQLDNQQRVMTINDAALKILGKKRLDLLGEDIRELFGDTPYHNFWSHCDRAIQNKSPERFEQWVEETNFWYAITIYPTDVGLTVLMRDITEVKKVQQEHLRNETVLRSIFDSSTDTFLLISPQLRVLAFNRKANLSITQIYGRETSVGDDFRKLIIPGTESDFYEHFHKALKGEVTHLEKDIVMPDLQRRWFRFHYYPVYNHENELIGVSFTAADIHELKSFSELIAEKSKTISEISFNQSHVIRQPLSSMLGIFEILDPRGLDPENRQLYDLLWPLCRQLDTIIRDNIYKASGRN